MKRNLLHVNVLVTCSAASQYSEVTGIFFLRFQNKEHVHRVNINNNAGGNSINEGYFEIECSHVSSKDEKRFVAYFCRFVTRSPKIFIFVIGEMFEFCNFQDISFDFLKLERSSFSSTLNSR